MFVPNSLTVRINLSSATFSLQFSGRLARIRVSVLDLIHNGLPSAITVRTGCIPHADTSNRRSGRLPLSSSKMPNFPFGACSGGST